MGEQMAAGSQTQGPRVVITHDFMETYGGAERVTAEIAAAFPEAPVVAIAGRPEVARRMGVEDRFVSLLRPRPALLRHYRLLAPLFPALIARFRVPDADVIVSSSYTFAHRLRSKNGAPRVCYTYSPLRFAWSMRDHYRDRWTRGPVSALAYDAFAAWMRVSDRRSSRGVFRYLAPGRYVAEQVSEFYGRDAEVIGAPVDCDLFRPGDEPPEDYYLFAGRLIEPYKQVTILVEAFNRTGEKLIVAGDGPERARLEKLAKPNIEFLGEVEDQRLIPLMQRCRAAVFPSQDDFGLIPVEVNACGRPVIAYAGGGALDTVVPGVTGELFEDQTANSLEEAVRSFDASHYDADDLRTHALRWSSDRFRDGILDAVERTYRESGSNGHRAAARPLSTA